MENKIEKNWGNLIFYANVCTLVAPNILVKEGFQGSFQAFAKQEIKVENLIEKLGDEISAPSRRVSSYIPHSWLLPNNFQMYWQSVSEGQASHCPPSLRQGQIFLSYREAIDIPSS